MALTEGSGGPSAVTARTGGDDGYVDRIDDLREAVESSQVQLGQALATMRIVASYCWVSGCGVAHRRR